MDRLKLNDRASWNDMFGPMAKQEDAIGAPKPSYFTVYGSADGISYTPEDVLKEGAGMVKALKTGLEELGLGGHELRDEVWQREIERCVSILPCHIWMRK